MVDTRSFLLPFLHSKSEPKLTRAEAARVNGSKSKGPKSIEGKAKSSMNARREHVIARRVAPLINRGGEHKEYHQHLRGLKDELRPETRLEINTVELVARDFVLLGQLGQVIVGQLANQPNKKVARPSESVSDLLFELSILDAAIDEAESDNPWSLPEEYQSTFVRLVARNLRAWRNAPADGDPSSITMDSGALTVSRWTDIRFVAEVVSGKVTLTAGEREAWIQLLLKLRDLGHGRMDQTVANEQLHEKACRDSLDPDGLSTLGFVIDLDAKVQRSLESRLDLLRKVRRMRKR